MLKGTGPSYASTFAYVSPNSAIPKSSRNFSLMALSAPPSVSLPLLRRLRGNPRDPAAAQLCLLRRSTCASLRSNRASSIRAAGATAPAASGNSTPAILLTEKALNHLTKMKAEKNEDLCLRIGVKQGGCSGMSYTMEFENRANAKEDDSLIEYDGFTMVCDPKSLLFVYGMQLDFSDALIGGGFSFKNPNATKTCGCGKSFATPSANGSEVVEPCGN